MYGRSNVSETGPARVWVPRRFMKLLIAILAAVAVTVLLPANPARADYFFTEDGLNWTATWDESTETLSIQVLSDGVRFTDITNSSKMLSPSLIRTVIIEDCPNITLDTSDFDPCKKLQTILIPADMDCEYNGSGKPTILTYSTTESVIQVDSVAGYYGGGLFIPPCVKSIAEGCFDSWLSENPNGVIFAEHDLLVPNHCSYYADDNGRIRTVLIPADDTMSSGWIDNAKAEAERILPSGTAILAVKSGETGTCVTEIWNAPGEIFLPEDVSSLAEGVFTGCTNLQMLIVPEELDLTEAGVSDAVILGYGDPEEASGSGGRVLTIIDGSCRGNVGDPEVIIVPRGLFTGISEYAFKECENAILYIPKSVSGAPTAIMSMNNGCTLIPYRPVEFIDKMDSTVMPGEFCYGSIPSAIWQLDSVRVQEETTSPDNPSFKKLWFVGWNTEPDGSGVPYPAGREILPHDNLTLYAQWGHLVTLEASDVEYSAVDGSGSGWNGGYAIVSGKTIADGSELSIYSKGETGYEPVPARITPIVAETTISAPEVEKQQYQLTVNKTDRGKDVKFTIDGGKENYNSPVKVDYNAQVTVTAQPDGFIGWFTPDGAMLADGDTYSFAMYRDFTLEARYRANNDSKFVKFMVNGCAVKIVEILFGDGIDDTDIPSPPVLYGMEFQGWRIGEGKLITDIDDAVAAINKELESKYELIVTAEYTEIEGSISVLVSKTTGSNTVTDDKLQLGKSQWVKRGPVDETWNGAVFSHWELDGEKVSSNRSVSFYAVKDCELTAVYKPNPAAGSTSFELTGARMLPGAGEDDKDLLLEARLENAGVGYSDVRFRYRCDGDEDQYLKCKPDPHVNGRYFAVLPDCKLGSIYAVTPIVTVGADVNGAVTGTVTYGKTVYVDPEIGFDSDEKACAVILDIFSEAYTDEDEDSYGDVCFTAFVTVPDGWTIDRAGILAYVFSEGEYSQQILDFHNDGPEDRIEECRLVRANGSSGVCSCSLKGVQTGIILEARPFVRYKNKNEDGMVRTYVGSRVQYGVEETEKPKFEECALVLSGRIGIVFFMDLPEQYHNSYMTFEIGHGTCTERVYFDDAILVNGKRGFICYVNSIQMAESVKATLHYNHGTVSETYSVREYIAGFDDIQSQFDDETIALVHALADYGHYVQPFLASVRNWALGTDYAVMDRSYAEASGYDYDTIRSDAAKKAISITDKSNGDIRKVTYSLTLDSDTAINVYFEPSSEYAGTFRAAVDKGAFAAYTKGSNGRYCVTIKGIAAHELRKDHTITVKTDDGQIDITVSAMSYVNSALEYYNDENDADREARTAVAAIWAYSRAADAYVVKHPNS